MKHGIAYIMRIVCSALFLVSCSESNMVTFVIPGGYNGFICVKGGDNGAHSNEDAVVSEEGYVVLSDFAQLENWTKFNMRYTNGEQIPHGLSGTSSKVYFWGLGRSHNGSVWMFVGTRETYAQVVPQWAEIISRNNGLDPVGFSF